MNERINDLMYHAGLTAQGCWDEMDDYAREAILKLAKLIVRECAQKLEDDGMVEVAMEIKEHFGVE